MWLKYYLRSNKPGKEKKEKRKRDAVFLSLFFKAKKKYLNHVLIVGKEFQAHPSQHSTGEKADSEMQRSIFRVTFGLILVKRC